MSDDVVVDKKKLYIDKHFIYMLLGLHQAQLLLYFALAVNIFNGFMYMMLLLIMSVIYYIPYFACMMLYKFPSILYYKGYKMIDDWIMGIIIGDRYNDNK